MDERCLKHYELYKKKSMLEKLPNAKSVRRLPEKKTRGLFEVPRIYKSKSKAKATSKK